MSTLLSADNVRARKPHICEQCSRRIQPGDTYHRQNSVGDNGFDTWRSCLQCLALAQDLFEAGIHGEDHESGADCLINLWDADWPDIRLMGPPWVERADLYAHRWPGGAEYPATTPAAPDPRVKD